MHTILSIRRALLNHTGHLIIRYIISHHTAASSSHHMMDLPNQIAPYKILPHTILYTLCHDELPKTEQHTSLTVYRRITHMTPGIEYYKNNFNNKIQ